jgi:hypothetical protein
MPYVGRSTDKISNVEVLDNITFDGSSSYTLQKGGSNFTPSSANTLLLSIDGVVQAGNFTVSGSTIDFGTAVAGTSTCDFILHYGVGLITAPSDGTVTTAKLADSSVSLAKLTATGTKDATTFLRGDNTFATVVSGLTMADQWRYTTATAGDGDLTSNLERNDSTGFGQLGTGMTESSGVFSFPSTGIYLINFSASFYNSTADSRFNRVNIKVTTNNSSYTDVSRGITSHNVIASTFTYSGAFTQYILDVTDTSNVKVMFNRDVQDNNTYIEGDTDRNKTFMTFIRLGDT